MTRTRLGMGLLVALVAAAPAEAQTPEARTRARLETLLAAASETPAGQGLVGTALAEAQAALTQAVAAAEGARDLGTIQAVRAHVKVRKCGPTCSRPAAA